MNPSERFFVITGGPGAGKTTLVEALRAAGFATADEAGRAILRDQMEIAGPASHSGNPALFAEIMLALDMQSHRRAGNEAGPVFFDRGVAELVGYMRLVGLPVPAHFRAAAERFRYNRRVFLAPFWPEIFERDVERRQTLDEARRTHDILVETYAELGYEMVSLPRAPVEERLRFVLGEAGLEGTAS